jgi:hypothetical protein
MKARIHKSTTKALALVVLVSLTLTPLASYAQTPTPTQIKLHGNKFKPEQDVQLGQEAAAEAEQKMQLIRDPDLAGYLERVGQRLAAAVPPEFQHPEFRYSFKVVNAKDINAFALPGGPMYVNSGMIAAARSEDEMAGVMAHEISHVALRHGTAQVTKQQKWQMLSGIMGMGGQILGGPLGTAAQLGSQGVGVYLLKFSREYETEADLLGARIMANAGYDPRELANMFKTIEGQGGGGAPSFLSDHPSPKDRVAKINQEAQALQINTAAAPDKHDFMIAQQRLTGRGGGGQFTGNQNQAYNNPGYSNQNQQPANTNQVYSNPQPATGGASNQPNTANSPSLPPPSGRVEATSSNYRPYKEGPFAVSIPDNWQELNEQSGLWFAPKGGYGGANGQNVFTHGVSFGAIKLEGKTTQVATDGFIKSMTQGNANMKARGGYVPMNNIAGRNWQLITFDNVNEATGRPELVNIATTPLKTGDLLYMIAVCPTNEYPNYQPVFLTILRSIQLTD